MPENKDKQEQVQEKSGAQAQKTEQQKADSEKTQNRSAGLLEKLSLDDQPWLSVDDWYLCRVKLGGDDHVDLMAISGSMGEELDELVKVAIQLKPESKDKTDALHLLKAALEGGFAEQVWDQIDKLFYRHITDWRLVDYAEKTGRDEPPPPPDVDDAGRRIQTLKSLPITVLARVIYGMAWHTRNFTATCSA